MYLQLGRVEFAENRSCGVGTDRLASRQRSGLDDSIQPLDTITITHL